ncbi:OHCU decarboxylase [Microthyrium microscopicum]|uniref:OHCU decarboxylase n=1 Tax=Microthyrium microscopicum TaxID=703497 RepID=A0A6A6U6B0_9PEZI|nr:OHCU decarboxylase [Microthyrium microscopicum]
MSKPLEKLPEISSLPTLPRETHEAIISLLFEPSPPLNTLATPSLANTTYGSYEALVDAVHGILKSTFDKEDFSTLDSILSAHPRLGEKKVESALSKAEQAAMIKASSGQGSGDAEKEAEILQALNKEYEETFPSLVYTVFVNGRPRSVIFEDMKERIKRRDINAERGDAIQAMCDIANDRANKLQ